MATWEIVLIAVVAALFVLFALGSAAVARRHARGEGTLAERIAQADRALADARAADRGWDRALLEQAARAALASRGATATELELVQVVDRPGTDQDRARFRAMTVDGPVELELARTGDAWHPA
jgi:hypothetical protein